MGLGTGLLSARSWRWFAGYSQLEEWGDSGLAVSISTSVSPLSVPIAPSISSSDPSATVRRWKFEARDVVLAAGDPWVVTSVIGVGDVIYRINTWGGYKFGALHTCNLPIDKLS